MRLLHAIGLVIICGFTSLTTYGQNNFKRKKPFDFSISGGTSHFFGDLGGRQKNAMVLFGYDDLDLSSSKPSLTCGLRFNVKDWLAFDAGLSYLYLAQRDENSFDPDIQIRNLSFKTNVLELATTVQLRVFRFDIKNKHKTSSWEYYVFGGVGTFYYNPKTEYEGKNIALRPLSTEGQGLRPNTKEYSPMAVSIPFGAGLRLGVKQRSSFFLQIGYRLTTTDYLDDVSTTYYNENELLLNRGKTAVEVSYRGDKEVYPEGSNRGNPEYKDSFLTIQFGYSFPVFTKRFH